MESLGEYVSVLQQAAKVVKDTAADENLQTGAKTIFGWIKGLFQGKSKAQANLDEFVEMPSQTQTIQATLENALNDSQIEELINKLKDFSLQLPAQAQPASNISVRGDKNIVIGGDISYNTINITQK